MDVIKGSKSHIASPDRTFLLFYDLKKTFVPLCLKTKQNISLLLFGSLWTSACCGERSLI